MEPSEMLLEREHSPVGEIMSRCEGYDEGYEIIIQVKKKSF